MSARDARLRLIGFRGEPGLSTEECLTQLKEGANIDIDNLDIINRQELDRETPTTKARLARVWREKKLGYPTGTLIRAVCDCFAHADAAAMAKCTSTGRTREQWAPKPIERITENAWRNLIVQVTGWSAVGDAAVNTVKTEHERRGYGSIPTAASVKRVLRACEDENIFGLGG